MLAPLLLIHSGAVWVLAYVLHGRLLAAFNRVALPLTALVFLVSAGTRNCRIVLEVPGIHSPLARLYAAAALSQ